MNTLKTEPLSSLLDRLFSEAETANSPAFDALSEEDQEELISSKTRYIELYSNLKELWLPVSRETGQLLYMLICATGAKNIVEFGTSFGLSTLHLGAGLRDSGGGKIISTEFELSKVNRARAHIAEAGMSDFIEVRAGDAMQTLRHEIPEKIDLLILDGAKALYSEILTLLENRLRPGALIVADDADMCPEYLERVRNDVSYVSVAFAGDIELTMKLF